MNNRRGLVRLSWPYGFPLDLFLFFALLAFTGSAARTFALHTSAYADAREGPLRFRPCTAIHNFLGHVLCFLFKSVIDCANPERDGCWFCRHDVGVSHVCLFVCGHSLTHQFSSYRIPAYTHPRISAADSGRSIFRDSSFAARTRCSISTGLPFPSSAARKAAFRAMFRMFPPAMFSC